MATQRLGYSGCGGTRKSLAALMVVLPMLLFSFIAGRAEAQGTAGNNTGNNTKTNGRAARQESLKLIADRLSQSTGVQVLVDRSLSREMLAFSPDTVTAQTLDDYLERLMRRLPPGSAALQIYLPDFGDTPRINPNAVAQLAWAQRDLLGRPAPNTVHIQGKTLSAAEAAPLINTLGLKPVYVLSHRQAPPPGVSPDNPADFQSVAMKYMKKVTDEIKKQLNVANIDDIPDGSYKVTISGDDGSPQNFTVEVGRTAEGARQISFKSTSGSPLE